MPDAPTPAGTEAEDDPRLGATRPERAGALQRARRIAQESRVAMLVACGWFVVWPVPYALLLAAVAAWPWFALFLCWKYRGAFAIDRPARGSPRGDLTLLIALPCGVLALRAILDSHLVIVGPLFLPAIAIWAALVACAHALGPGWRGWRSFPLLVFMAFPYAPSALALADQAFDFAEPASLRVAVTGKRTSAGRGRIHYLRVPPWGLRRRENEIEVKRDLYGSVAPGGAVCLQVHPGALGMPWYEVAPAERC